jgi:hypothetical protein
MRALRRGPRATSHSRRCRTMLVLQKVREVSIRVPAVEESVADQLTVYPRPVMQAEKARL